MINREMKPIQLQQKNKIQNDFGEEIYEWNTVRNVEMAIYPTNSGIYTTNAKYQDISHTGITRDKAITVSNRLLKGTKIYEILNVNSKGRLTTLTLKEVIYDV